MKETIILHTPKTLSFSKRIVKCLPQAVWRRLPAEISVVAVSEKESAALNRRYRGKNKPANVLSFWYGKEYGEIIVCASIIRSEAKKEKHSFEYQMTWYILHGMIHLSGLHHEQSTAAAKKSEALEINILQTLFQKSGTQHHRIS